MRFGIDASNLRVGGTVTHLIEFLRVADPQRHGFEQVFVWAGSAVLNRIDDRPWLRKCAEPLLEQALDPLRDRGHLKRAYWQRFRLPKLARAAGCDLLFVPGGMDNSAFRPMVTMSRNMLPFEWEEARRYGWSLSRLRLVLLRRLQTRTFRRAQGLILLTDYARRQISRAQPLDDIHTAIIPHGVSTRFKRAPRDQRALAEFSVDRPFRILYVSRVDMYKHQWHVAKAVASLRARGFPIYLDLIGPAHGGALRLLNETLAGIEHAAEFIRYHGSVAYEQLPAYYEQAHLKVFASSCENMPNILIEAMSAGLPIACSDRGPMPEVLGDGGVYFDPEQPAKIAAAIGELLESPQLRSEKAETAYNRAQRYSWNRCAEETLTFLAERARGTRN